MGIEIEQKKGEEESECTEELLNISWLGTMGGRTGR